MTHLFVHWFPAALILLALTVLLTPPQRGSYRPFRRGGVTGRAGAYPPAVAVRVPSSQNTPPLPSGRLLSERGSAKPDLVPGSQRERLPSEPPRSESSLSSAQVSPTWPIAPADAPPHARAAGAPNHQVIL